MQLLHSNSFTGACSRSGTRV